MNFEDKKIWIISPHIDDAFLSLWWFILNENINLEIINIFNITNYTINWIFSVDDISNIRKEEDYSIFKSLWVKTTYFNYLDAIIRIWTNENDYINEKYIIEDDSIFNKLKNELVEFIINNNYDIIFFPLWLWNHIDHLIVSKIWKLLQLEGYNIIFYEDVAYEESLKDIDQNNMKKEIYNFKNINDKIEKLKNYKTQIDLEIIELVKQTYYNKKWEVMWFPL